MLQELIDIYVKTEETGMIVSEIMSSIDNNAHMIQVLLSVEQVQWAIKRAEETHKQSGDLLYLFESACPLCCAYVDDLIYSRIYDAWICKSCEQKETVK